MAGTFFVISAPSGAGKTTIVSLLLNRLSDSITRVVTYTTRTPSSHEVDGRDYHFISKESFEQKIATGFFLEWSCEYEHYYGLPNSIITQVGQGRSYIAILDRKGVASVLQAYSAAVPIWIYTNNLDTLRERLINRARDSREVIERRMVQAQKECEEEKMHNLFRYHILNENLESAVDELEQIVCRYLGHSHRR